MSEKALAWLQANPNHEKASLVKSKLQEMNVDIPFDRNIKNEAHPAVSWTDRTLVKNLSQGNGLGYLKRKYPNLQVDQDADGEVILKGKKENEWRKLDPSTLELADISDVFYDVGAGIVEGGAALAGGLAGNVPGAMAASGVTAAGLETARQGIGKALGVNEEMDPTQIAAAGLGSALLTPLAGVGKASPAFKSKLSQVLGKDLTKNTMSELAEKGVLKKGYENFTRGALPSIAQVTSGEKAKVFRDYTSNLDTMKEWKKNPRAFELFVEDAGRTFEKNLDLNVESAGRKIGEVLSELPDTEVSNIIEVTPLVREFTQEIDVLRRVTPDGSVDIENLELADVMEKELQRKLGKWKKNDQGNIVFNGWKDKISYDDAKSAQKKFLKLNKDFGKSVVGDPIASVKTNLGNRGYMGMKDVIEKSFDKVQGGLGDKLREANKGYVDALDVKERLQSQVFKKGKGTSKKDYSKSFATLRTLDNNSKKILKEQMGRIDPSILQKADKIEAYSRLNEAGFFPTSGTATSTSRSAGMGTVGAAVGAATNAGGMGGAPGNVIGAGVGLLGLGPRSWRFYFSQGKRGEDFLKNQFRKAGKPIPKNLKEYYNKQMAAQSIWGTMQSRSGQKNKEE